MRLILALLVFPLLEIAVFILVGDAIGVGPTLLLIVASAVIGLVLLRRHGVDTLRRAQVRIDRGEPPVREAFDGLCIAVAGLLLFIPGFISDIFGLLLFLPPVRGWLFRRAGIVAMGRSGAGVRAADPTGYDPARRGSTTVIEGEFTEIVVRTEDPAGPTGPDEIPPPDSRWRPTPRN